MGGGEGKKNKKKSLPTQGVVLFLLRLLLLLLKLVLNSIWSTIAALSIAVPMHQSSLALSVGGGMKTIINGSSMVVVKLLYALC